MALTSTDKQVSSLIINKVPSEDVYQQMVAQNLVNDDEIYIVQDNDKTTIDPATATPKANGTASVGTSLKYAREDHVHPAQEIPVQSVNNKTGAVSLTANDVGAVSKTGDTMTGNLTVGSASLQTNGYVTGTWLKTTANTALSWAASKIAVINDGWVYSRTTAQIKSDIGLGNVDNVKQYSASNPPPYPVKSVNGKTGAVTVREVPAVTTADNGKFLRVVSGAWAAVEIANANGGSF